MCSSSGDRALVCCASFVCAAPSSALDPPNMGKKWPCRKNSVVIILLGICKQRLSVSQKVSMTKQSSTPRKFTLGNQWVYGDYFTEHQERVTGRIVNDLKASPSQYWWRLPTSLSILLVSPAKLHTNVSEQWLDYQKTVQWCPQLHPSFYEGISAVTGLIVIDVCKQAQLIQ